MSDSLQIKLYIKYESHEYCPVDFIIFYFIYMYIFIKLLVEKFKIIFMFKIKEGRVVLKFKAFIFY